MIIRGAMLLDGVGGQLRDKAEVVIDKGRIAALGSVDASVRQDRGPVLEFSGATIMPGLIDCHVHLSGFHCGEPAELPDDQELKVGLDCAAVAHGLDGLLRAGITTVRDCGYPHHGIFGLRHAQRMGLLTGPRMILSGRGISTTGGHATAISVEADGVDEVRRAVRKEMRAGADWIKLMVTGGTGSPHERTEDVQLSADEARVAALEAHARGRRVAAHCSNLEGALVAIGAGADSIEHGIVLDEEAVNRMAAKGTWLAAGLRCTQVEADAPADSVIPAYVRDKASRIVDAQAASFRRALQAGVKVGAATDAGPRYFPLGADSMIAELETMRELGMSPLDSLSAATGRAAELLGLDGLGILRPGAIADVLVVDGDPLESLDALRRPLLVLKQGEPHGGFPTS